MRFWQIVLRSLRQHWLSTGLAVFSIALGVALLAAVASLREQAHRNFTQEGLGVDAVLGPKGSPLQIVLNAVYHLDDMPAKIKWTYYESVLKSTLTYGGQDISIVESGIPFCTGHSYAGFRVNAIDDRFFTDFEYQTGRHFSFRPEDGGQGRMFKAREEAVAGWEAARALNLRLGQTFNPVCGINAGDPVHIHDNIKFVGIMARTGTPHDRAIYIPLKTFYTLEGHGQDVARMADNEEYREISGAYLKIKRILRNENNPDGVIHPAILDLQYNINQSSTAQLVIPKDVLPRLFTIIGWVDSVLMVIGVLVTLLAALFLVVVLISALRERRRDIALLRALGAQRRTVFGLMLCESLAITLLGGVLGIAAGHGLTAVGCHFITVETGLRFSPLFVSAADLWMLPGMAALGVLAGLGPAIQAYRLGVLKNLTPIS